MGRHRREYLKLLTLNVNCSKKNRSIFKLLDDLRILTSEGNIDVLSLTETDIENGKLAKEFSIEGYQTFIQESQGKIRTMMLVKEKLKAKNKTKPTLLPSVSVEIETKGQKPLLVSSIYRQWSTPDPYKELDTLKETLTEIKNNRVIIMGDFNLDAKRLTQTTYCHHKLGRKLLDICEEFDLCIKAGGPTFVHKNGESTLDFFLVSNHIPITDVKTVPFGNSDHEPVALSVETNVKRQEQKKKVWTRSKIMNEIDFRLDMATTMATTGRNMLNTLDVNTQAELFISSFVTVMDKHAPFRMKSIKTTKPRHALSRETLDLRAERNKYRNAWLKASPEQKRSKMERYKEVRNKVNSLIRRDRILKTEHDLKNGKNPYEVANSLLGKKKNINDSIELAEGDRTINKEYEVAEILNSFFIEKINGLKGKIDPKFKQDPLNKIQNHSGEFCFQQVSIEHTEKIIKKMKSSNSSGPDGISSKMLKMVSTEVAPALSVLINSSLTSGVYPELFKQAKVIPLYKKKGSNKDKTNYRPVSNLSTPGKVLEVAVNIQVTRYCERLGIFGNHQHGFRQGRSTSSALVSTLMAWQDARERNLFTGCCLYDLSAAYDTISPEILTKKARSYGFNSIACRWIKSFTTGRLQAVKIGEATSGLKELSCGIPQGSPLSCALFLLYVGDLPRWVKSGHIQGYADDTIHYVSGRSEEKVIEMLENEARRIFSYFSSNDLVANPSKTAFLLIRPNGSTVKRRKITLGESIIEESESERILGLQVQRTLEWNEHLAKVTSKVNHGIAMLRQLQGLMRKNALKAIAEGVVMSHIRYGASIYLSQSVRIEDNDPIPIELQNLQIKQNDVMRLILRKNRKDQVSRMDLLTECEMMSVNQIAASAILMEVWRAFKNQVSSITESYQRDTSERRQKALRTSKNKRSFKSKSACLWNQTNSEIQSVTTSVRKAKNLVKNFVSKLPGV